MNIVHSFGYRRSTIGDSDIQKRQFGAGLLPGLFAGAGQNSCFVCGLIRWHKGCFPPGVKIVMGDGSETKKVEEVSAGDLIWNPVLKKAAKILRISEGPEKKDIVVIQAGALTLRVSSEHPVLTNKGMLQAQHVAVGASVTDSSGVQHNVSAVSREKATPGLTVINFILERSASEHDGLLVADGMIVGDLLIQHSLAEKKK